MASSLNNTNTSRPNAVLVKISNMNVITPTITSGSAYSAGNCVGGLLTLPLSYTSSGLTLFLNDLIVIDKSNQKVAYTILFFSANPIAGTYTDKVATALSTDVSLIVGQVLIATADYTSTNSIGIADKTAINTILQNTESTQSLYMVVTTTGTPTYTSTSDLTFKLKYYAD